MKSAAFDHDPMRPLDLIAMGRVAVDLYAEQIGAPLSEAQTFRKYLGGCAGNIAVGCARLGLRVSMLSCVGADHMGDFLRNTLVSEGVEVSALQESAQHLTGLVMLGVCPPDHFPLIFFRNGCADMAIDSQAISKDYLARAKALLVTGTGLSHPKTRDVTMLAVKLAKEVNTKIILDIDYRPVLWGLLPPGDGENRYLESPLVSEVFSSILPLTDLVVGTVEECRIAGGSEDFAAALRNIRAMTASPIVVKRGEQGASAYFGSLSQPMSGERFTVTVVNVLGAGDAFMSGLLAILLKGGHFVDALRNANAAGAMVVARHGCSPASPSREELDYFLAHAHVDDVVASPSVALLHQRVILKDHARCAPMPVFAFCHRWQLEEVCTRMGKPVEHIREFKTTLAEALVACSRANHLENPSMLCDPHYGKDAIKVAQQGKVGVIVAIEKSGVMLTEWLKPESAYEILINQPPSFGVKILWQFHENLNDEEKHHQLSRLKELERACLSLDRKLMLELIVPKHLNGGDDQLLNAIAAVYRAGIHPYWWKLPCFQHEASFTQLGSMIDEFDSRARVLILGGDVKSLSDYGKDFARAKTTHHSIGFAVGRSIFWPSFLSFIEGKMSRDDVKAEVAERFLHLYRLWNAA